MTERELFLSIGDLDESLAAWADRPPVRHAPWKWMAVAAAAVILVAGVWGVARLKSHDLPVEPPDSGPISLLTSTYPLTTPTTTAPTKPPVADTAPGGLPWLTGGISSSGGGAGGHNGYVFTYGTEELALSTLWEEAPETMTVWRVSDDYNGDYDRQLSIIRQYATLLGDDIGQADISTVVGTDSPYSIDSGRFTKAVTDRYRYELSSDYTYLAIRLQQPVAVGEQENWLAGVQALYPELFWGMTTPAIHITGGDRGWGITEADPDIMFATEAYYSARIYDAADEDGHAAAFLKGVGLHISEGLLKGFYLYLPDYYETLGEYPVLSRQEARAALESRCAAYLAGGYPDPAIDETYQVMGMELVYFGDSNARLRVPVYRFLLTAADTPLVTKVKEDTGMQVFVEVNISAVPGAYWHPDAAGVWSVI
ncbi:MAG: hypothetical protein J6R77_03820 [Clostridia bacterium]|nr:hypothetical protein [Clostridia bacterium]